MSESVTKQNLNTLREATKRDLHDFRDGLEATITANTKDIISHFNQSQGLQNEQLGRIEQDLVEANTKLNAIMDALATRQEVRNLVRELRSQGLTLDESKIFIA